ncbi:LysR family transcriptional regulator [Roseovarius faecimaris]|uniref:LysR family transcriptional regulator n=1 Tax=Roseovarius faecimaris TaxID=2494550 RepID=A0A6I6IX77_9RHOB|nr:LysR family transcriptional regulator [Roseovarius faecimaris]QGX97238.1 LysR family transcriptional regulator [Roseovarius faecimaris]
MSHPLRLSLKTLRAFAAVVEHGSISKAADALNVAASAVSAALDQVEAEFGTTLLIRTRARGIAATVEGREMAARFRALLDDYSTILDEGRALTHSLSGTLRIGYYAPVAPAFLPSLLRPLMAQNPELNVDLHEHDNDSAQEALLAGQLDVILFAGHDLRPGISVQTLLDLPPYVLAPEGHPITGATHARLEQVAEYPLIQLDRPLARPYMEGLFRQRGLRPRIAARADSTEMVRSLVGAGAGLAVLSMRPRTAISYGGDNLVAIPLEPELPGLHLLAGHAMRHPRKLVSVFLEVLENWTRTPEATGLTVR